MEPGSISPVILYSFVEGCCRWGKKTQGSVLPHVAEQYVQSITITRMHYIALVLKAARLLILPLVTFRRCVKQATLLTGLQLATIPTLTDRRSPSQLAVLNNGSLKHLGTARLLTLVTFGIYQEAG